MGTVAHRILIVDDDPEVRSSLRDLLVTIPGVEVELTSGVAEGRAAALGGSWDIVMSDEQMPDGHGSEMLAELNRARPGVHYVLMSGFHDFDMLLRGLNAAHIDHFIQKPYDPKHVVDWVQRTLKDREHWGAVRRVRPGPFRRLGGAGGIAAPAPLAAPEAPAAAPEPRRWVAARTTSGGASLLEPSPILAEERAPPMPPPAPAPPAPRAEPARAPAPAATPATDGARLLFDALNRTVNDGLRDIALLIRWATESPRVDERLRHVRMAQRRMEDTARNLETLSSDGP